jgi:cytosine/adenosine deaminase-related metal-dependent hydrolase
MALAGISSVGEFHYLHHAPGGRAYHDPNAMSEALVQAASDAGIRLTLLDTIYLTGGMDADGYLPLDPVQQRFSDGDVTSWAFRVAAMRERDGLRVGAAVHSIRAVPAEQLSAVPTDLVHVHLSEQPAENAACQAHHGCSPTELLATHGLLGREPPRCMPPTCRTPTSSGSGARGHRCAPAPLPRRTSPTGSGPFRRLSAAGSPLCLGSDQHAVIDLLADARAVESYERLAGGRRGVFTPAELLDALTVSGHRSWAGTTPAHWRSASAPTWSRSRWTLPRPRASTRPRW